MARRSALHLVVLLASLALVLPLAAVADSCVDCLGASSPDCCPPSCCSCCAHGGATLGGLAGLVAAQELTGPAGDPAENRALPADPRDVFHVPKSSLG